MTYNKPTNKGSTKFRDEYCGMLVEHMAGGLSIDSFAGLIKVTRQTLYNWFKEYPDFLSAKELGMPQNLLYWEKIGIAALHGAKDFNNTLWIFNMKNRHNWTDKVELAPPAIQEDPEYDRLSTEELKKLV